MAKDTLNGREILVEFYPVGQIVKVSAMDTQTLTEVVIQGPAYASSETLIHNVKKRLEYVLRKRGYIK